MVFRFLRRLTRQGNNYQKTGTTFLTKTIEKEMANVRIAFEVLKGLTLEHMREGEVNQDLNMLEQPDFYM